MQLALRNGTVVTPDATFRADLGIDGGVIVQVGGEVPPAATEVDATGKLVLPGGVDIHTHLASFGSDLTVDDFESGSRAAAAGGVTTVCDFAYQRDGEGLGPALERAHADARRSIVDYSFHVVLRDPSSAATAEIPGLADEGAAGLKLFMSTTRFTARAREFYRALDVAGSAGLLTAIHAEDEPTFAHCTTRLLEAGHRGVEWFPESRPPVSEAIAVRRAIAMAEITGAPIYLVHLSCVGALEALAEARDRGLPVYGETRPIYLYLTRDIYALPDGDGAKFVGHPPLREEEDLEAVWVALRSGLLSTVCSDHIPYALATKKDPSHRFDTIPPGMANLETQMPMLYSEGVRTGRISLGRMVEVLCTNPARIAGMGARKGTIAPGMDGDLVVFDPERRRTLRAEEMQSACDYEIFEGREVIGWPAVTISRGEVIFEDGRVTATPGRGAFIRRERFGR
ncbi:MAG: dihydropyrimidinase [Dehalococcoidia bacterium]